MKKKIRLDDFFTGDNSIIKPRKKPQPKYIQPQWITDYMKERDRLIYKNADGETKAQLLERWTAKTQ